MKTTQRARLKVKRAAKVVAKTSTRAARSMTPARRKSPQHKSVTKRDAIALLKDDHKKLRALLKALQAAQGTERRTKLIEQTGDALKLHTELEEQYFYPAFREAAQSKRDRQMFHEATEEHHAVDIVLPEVKQAAYEPDVFSARAKVLKELVEHHIEEEHDDLFPRARKLLSAADLREIGLRMAERQRAAAKPAGALQAMGAMLGLGS